MTQREAYGPLRRGHQVGYKSPRRVATEVIGNAVSIALTRRHPPRTDCRASEARQGRSPAPRRTENPAHGGACKARSRTGLQELEGCRSNASLRSLLGAGKSLVGRSTRPAISPHLDLQRHPAFAFALASACGSTGASGICEANGRSIVGHYASKKDSKNAYNQRHKNNKSGR